MVLRVKLRGSGIPGDPYGVALPTYHLLHGNITQGYALVAIADDIHGLTPDDLKDETVEHTTEGDYYPALSEPALSRLHAYLDNRYVEHKGKFRVEIA